MPARSLVVTLFVAALSLCPPTHSWVPSSTPPERDRIALENGITVLLYPVKGAERVVVTPSYGVGFMHEPKGRPQLAHLIEHLACRCATKSYGAEQSFNLFQHKGDVNAETLPDFTYYYYMVPPADLELALKVEAERLTSLRVTPEAIEAETRKCGAEAGFVERSPRKMVGKFGLMALQQAWRHGLDRANVKSGLESTPVSEVDAFRRACMQPRNMTLIVMGDFDRARVHSLIRKHLGSIRGSIPRPQPLMTRIPNQSLVKWDVTTSAVVVSYLPPPDPSERLILSYYGALLSMKLMRDPAIKAVADGVETSNILFRVGALPFYVSATPKAGVSLDRLQTVLTNRLQAVLSQKADNMDAQAVQAAAFQDAQPPPLTPAILKQMAQMYQMQLRLDAKRAAGAALVQASIDITRRERLLSPQSRTALQAVQSVTPNKLEALLRRTLSPSRRFVTRLLSTP